jgi:hypothetical protein
MIEFFLVDVNINDALDSDFSEGQIKSWFNEHKEEFILNLHEYAHNELKYFLKELYPLE